MTASETGTAAETHGGGLGLTIFRYLVSVVVGGIALSLPLSTQLDGILVPLALAVSVLGAVVVGLPIALLMRHKGWRRFYHAVLAGGLLGLIPWGLLDGLHGLWEAAIGAGVALVAWLALKFQTLPLRFIPPKAGVAAAGVLAVAALGLSIAATDVGAILLFGPPATPESIKTVAAFEVPLPSEQDRTRFLALLRREAAQGGLHVDVADSAFLQQSAQASPEAAATIDAAVYRGAKDNRPEGNATDMFHVGTVWINFYRGENPELAKQFRDRVMRQVVEQWPGTLTLPVLPTGGVPLGDDMVKTSTGYLVKGSAASRYNLSVGSPLLAPNSAPATN